uniref:Uncharacterized protein n=1 Tax=Sphaerodactylus townsendi TaxID=933632 RepID=A0ACB8EG03_9SAUR
MSSVLAAPSLPSNPEDPSPTRATRLPRPFLRSLRTLFEILDDQRSGTVHLSEIESRWGCGGSGVTPQGDKERCQLPAGVLQALQQVAEPCGGYLSFPRLVAGLRIALLRAEEEEEKTRERSGARPAESGRSSSQSMKNLSRIKPCPQRSIPQEEAGYVVTIELLPFGETRYRSQKFFGTGKGSGRSETEMRGLQGELPGFSK